MDPKVFQYRRRSKTKIIASCSFSRGIGKPGRWRSTDMHEREQRMRRRIAELEDYAQKRVCPIYGISGNKGQLIGSGFLLKVNEKTLLISAAHVLDAKTELDWHDPALGWSYPLRDSFSPLANTTRMGSRTTS